MGYNIMGVQDQNPEYMARVDTWDRIDNVIRGYAKQYIKDIEPRFPIGHVMYDARRDWLAERSCTNYRHGAIFINFAAQTLNAIIALALNCPAIREDLPAKLEYLRNDATGNGLSLDQLKQKLLASMISVGRAVLFTDYPDVDPSLDRATQEAMNLGPRMNVFDPRSAFNWKTRMVNGKEVLSLVVVSKCVEATDNTDKFAWKNELRYLVLELDEDGYYMQSELNKGGQTVVQPFYPLANGKKLTKIPLTFLGSENNDPRCDVSPLESLVDLNIGHLRNSAIYEDNLIKYGRGTLTVTSDMQDFGEYYKDRPLILGTDEGYFLGGQGAFNIVQLQPAQEAAIAMTQKQEQIIMIGGHIVSNNPTNISAETTKLNMGEKVSMLNTIIGNLEDGLNEHINICAMFVGLPPLIDDTYIQMSREFIDQVADANVMSQLLAAMNGAAIPKRIYLNYLQSVGIICADEDIDALIEEVDSEDPFANQPVLPMPGQQSIIKAVPDTNLED